MVNNVEGNHRFHADGLVSQIIVEKKYSRALDGIDSFSHVVVLFWLHGIRSGERRILKVHPRRDMSLPLTGVFATRSPARPNPIGITAVKLLKREGNVLTVQGLDAINGTPVLDIKPYIPEDFSGPEIKVADWSRK